MALKDISSNFPITRTQFFYWTSKGRQKGRSQITVRG